MGYTSARAISAHGPMARRKPVLEVADRPHALRTRSPDPRKRIVRRTITERIGTTEREIGSVYHLEAADHVELLAPVLGPDLHYIASELHSLWRAVTRRTTGSYGEPGGGVDDPLDRRGPRDKINDCLRVMGQWRSAEVVAVVCHGEAWRPDGRPRDIGLVREGLDLVRQAGVLR